MIDGTEIKGQKVISDNLLDVLDSLTEREQKILSLYYGLNGDDPASLQKIGADFNVSPARIKEILERALKKMHHPSRQRKLRWHDGGFSVSAEQFLIGKTESSYVEMIKQLYLNEIRNLVLGRRYDCKHIDILLKNNNFEYKNDGDMEFKSLFRMTFKKTTQNGTDL